MEIYVFVFGIHLCEFSLVVKATEPVGMFCLLTCVFFLLCVHDACLFYVYMRVKMSFDVFFFEIEARIYVTFFKS